MGIVALAALAACVGEDPPFVSPTTPAGDAAPAPGPVDSEVDDDAGSTLPVDSGADADAQDQDASDGPTRFCGTQTAGAGVKDFFCADFDGTDPAEGFTSANVPDGGALVRFTDVAYSAPASLVTQGNATVLWEKVDAANFSELDVAVRLNVATLGAVPPPRDGSMTIIELSAALTNIGLAYSRGATVDGQTNYTGYFLFGRACPSSCVSSMKRVSGVPVNTWTSIRLRWTSAGTVGLSIDGTSAFDGTLYGATASKVTVRTGHRAVGNAPVTARHAFDNLMISVKR